MATGRRKRSRRVLSKPGLRDDQVYHELFALSLSWQINEDRGTGGQFLAWLPKRDRLSLLRFISESLEDRAKKATVKRGVKADLAREQLIRDAAIEVLRTLHDGRRLPEKAIKADCAVKYSIPLTALSRAVARRRDYIRSFSEDLGLPPLSDDLSDDELNQLSEEAAILDDSAMATLSRIAAINPHLSLAPDQIMDMIDAHKPDAE